MNLPEFGFLREKQICGDPDANPPIPGIYPVSLSTWRAGVREGLYPAPVKLARRAIGWRVEDIKKLVETGLVRREG